MGPPIPLLDSAALAVDPGPLDSQVNSIKLVELLLGKCFNFSSACILCLCVLRTDYASFIQLVIVPGSTVQQCIALALTLRRESAVHNAQELESFTNKAMNFQTCDHE